MPHKTRDAWRKQLVFSRCPKEKRGHTESCKIRICLRGSCWEYRKSSRFVGTNGAGPLAMLSIAILFLPRLSQNRFRKHSKILQIHLQGGISTILSLQNLAKFLNWHSYQDGVKPNTVTYSSLVPLCCTDFC